MHLFFSNKVDLSQRRSLVIPRNSLAWKLHCLSQICTNLILLSLVLCFFILNHFNTQSNVVKIGSKIIVSLLQSESATHSLQCFSSLIDYQQPKVTREANRGLKLRVTRGSHETQIKVLRAAFKKVKKLLSNFPLKPKNSWK